MAALASQQVVHGECSASAGQTPIIITGTLGKKSKWRLKWLERRFELYTNKSMQYFEPLSGKLLGSVDLRLGSAVRTVNGAGEFSDGKLLQIRDATGKLFLLQARNVETRDTWAHHVARIITGSSGQATGLGTTVNFGGDAGAHVDVVVPTGFTSKAGGGDLGVKLLDGRLLKVTVAPGTNGGTVLRAVGPVHNPNGFHVDAGLACADDHLDRTRVPIVVPSSQHPDEHWGDALGHFGASNGQTANRQAAAAAGGQGGSSEASGSSGFHERYDVTDEQEAMETEAQSQSKKISTGLYDMAMLTRLGKMEEKFRGELAEVWGVDDEDDLPDSLQELDFNDILASGDSEGVRTAWLLIRLTSAEGYGEKMKATVAALVENTILSIQTLENEYVKA